MKQADIGLIGLAVMGENLIMNMESKGFTVACYNRTTEKVDAFVNGRAKGKNIIGCHSIAELVANLEKPRKVFCMVKAGAAVDAQEMTYADTGSGQVCVILAGFAQNAKGGEIFRMRFSLRDGTAGLFSDVTLLDVELAAKDGLTDLSAADPLTVVNGMVRSLAADAAAARLEEAFRVAPQTALGSLALGAGDGLVADAVRRRAAFWSDGRTNAVRVVNAESDGLPGVIADVYNGFAVVQLASAVPWTGHDVGFVRSTASSASSSGTAFLPCPACPLGCPPTRLLSSSDELGFTGIFDDGVELPNGLAVAGAAAPPHCASLRRAFSSSRALILRSFAAKGFDCLYDLD